MLLCHQSVLMRGGPVFHETAKAVQISIFTAVEPVDTHNVPHCCLYYQLQRKQAQDTAQSCP